MSKFLFIQNHKEKEAKKIALVTTYKKTLGDLLTEHYPDGDFKLAYDGTFLFKIRIGAVSYDSTRYNIKASFKYFMPHWFEFRRGYQYETHDSDKIESSLMVASGISIDPSNTDVNADMRLFNKFVDALNSTMEVLVPLIRQWVDIYYNQCEYYCLYYVEKHYKVEANQYIDYLKSWSLVNGWIPFGPSSISYYNDTFRSDTHTWGYIPMMKICDDNTIQMIWCNTDFDTMLDAKKVGIFSYFDYFSENNFLNIIDFKVPPQIYIGDLFRIYDKKVDARFNVAVWLYNISGFIRSYAGSVLCVKTKRSTYRYSDSERELFKSYSGQYDSVSRRRATVEPLTSSSMPLIVDPDFLDSESYIDSEPFAHALVNKCTNLIILRWLAINHPSLMEYTNPNWVNIDRVVDSKNGSYVKNLLDSMKSKLKKQK